MNFFEAQDKARRQTGWLILLFALAVAGMIVLVNLLVLALMAINQTGTSDFSPAVLRQQFQWDVFIGVAIAILALVFLGSLYKTMALSGGGSRVAEMLGGRLIGANTRVPDEKQLLNVVEEMAIASGTPVPQVYVLEESGINAFAAGLNPNNAVIGITRGALDSLNRDELQGVIAHEFSHIFNGDMRMNIRLIGVLHGILLLGLMGYYLLRASRYTRRSNSRRGDATTVIVVLGVGLVVIGYVGHFFGQLIKAMISRQREFLADASAVQFTRNNQGIAGALKKIGGNATGSLLNNPSAPQFSHAYFAQGVRGFLQSLFATHPPLATRIKRVEPTWDGEFIVPVMKPRVVEQGGGVTQAASGGVAGAAVAAMSAGQMVEQVGTVNGQQVDAAREILAAIPLALREAASEPFGARAVIYGLLIDRRYRVESEQRRLLEQLAYAGVADLSERLAPDLQTLPEFARLPLLELTLPALQLLSAEQYRRFRGGVRALIAADKKVDLKEWILQRLVIRRLDQAFGLRKPAKAVHGQLVAVKAELQVLLSMIAHIENSDPDEALRAFEAGCVESGVAELTLLPREVLNVAKLDAALNALERLKPLAKPRLLNACATCIMFDGRTTIRARELLRTVSSCLDSPMPLLVGPPA